MEVGVFTDVTGDQLSLSCWDLKTGVLLKSFKNASCMRKGLAIVHKQFVFAAQHGQQIINIYRVHKDQLLKKIICPDKISALAASPDGHYIVVGLVEKIYVWQVTTGNLMCILSKHYQTINGIQFTRDGRFFVSYSKDNVLLVWDLNKVLQGHSGINTIESNISPLHVLSNHAMAIQDVYIGIGGIRCHVATCSSDQTCKVFDLFSGTLLCNFVFDSMCTAVTMDTMEKNMFVGFSNGNIIAVNCADQVHRRDEHVDTNSGTSTFIGHKNVITSLCVTHDAQQLVSGSYDCTVKLWHIQSKQCLRTFDFKGEVTNTLLCSFATFQPSSCQLQLPRDNFKRSCYIPKDVNLSELTDDTFETVPVILKKIRNNQNEKRNHVQDVLDENTTLKTPNLLWGANKTLSRAELECKVSVLETMAQRFYQFSSDAALKQFIANDSSSPTT